MDRPFPIEDSRPARSGWGSALLARVVLVAAAPGTDALAGTRDPAPHRQTSRVWPGALAKAVLRMVGQRVCPAAPGVQWRPLAAAVPAHERPTAPVIGGGRIARVREALLALPPPACL